MPAPSSEIVYAIWDSPVGALLLAGDGTALGRIRFPADRRAGPPPPDWRRDDGAFGKAIEQLTAYFAGALTAFDLPLRPAGTPFQQTVWRALREIPFGETTSYGALAARIGRPTASRAVGAANGANPLPIIVPCHRVIGANGSLTGFGGGVEVKRFLLDHERRDNPEKDLL